MHNVGRIIACFVAVVLVILFPLPYLAQSQNENVDHNIADYTHQISDEIRNKGFLDKSMYERYVNFLDTTEELYDIDIEDIHPVTGDEMYVANVEDNDLKVMASTEGHSEVCHCSHCDSANDNKLIQLSDRFSLDKLLSLSPEGSNLQELKPRMLSASTKVMNAEIHSFAAHTHTDDCYAGHRHNDSCYAYTGILNGPIRISLSGINERNYYDATYRDAEIKISCYVCDNEILTIRWTDCIRNEIPGGTEDRDGIGISGRYYNSRGAHILAFNDGYNRTNCDFDQATNDFMNLFNYLRPYCDQARPEDRMYWNYNVYINNMPKIPILGAYCGCCFCDGMLNTEPKLNVVCGQTQDETPICNQVVTGITATNPNQTIVQGNNIITTATATYLDGHTGTVNCTISGFNANVVGTQTATLTYQGLVGNARTTGIRTCTVNVTVKSAKTITSLSVTPTSQIINRNGSPSFSVKAYYSDGTNAVLTHGEYNVSATDYSVPGPHTVTVSCTVGEVTKSVKVIVYVDALSSITVTPSTQLVERYTPVEAIPLTVTATYLYSGSKVFNNGYEVNGYTPSTLGEQNISVSYTDSGIKQSANVKITVTVLHRTCPHCHNSYDLNKDDTDPGCPYCKKLITGLLVTPENPEVEQGQSLPITVDAVYKDGSTATVTGWTSNYSPNKTGLQQVTIEYGGFARDITVWVREATITCPVCGNKYPVSQGKCPVCAETVVSISAVPNVVTVNQYDNINLTVKASYADGSSRIITDWTIDHTTAVTGTFSATIAYRNASTKITLNVKSLSAVTCPICGLIYEPSENPRGCPVCSNLLTGIEAYLASGSNMVQYGTTPSLAVVLIYKDTHREIVTEDYTLENYDAHKLGKQTVKVLYKDLVTTLEIEVVDTLSSVTCPKGHVYFLDEDGNDPGCPYCRMSESLSSVYYFDITYLYEILEVVYAQGVYYFDKGNYITVNVTKRDSSLLTKTQHMFFKTAVLGRKKRYVYGGEVL